MCVLFCVFSLQERISAVGHSTSEFLLITVSHIGRIEENINKKFYLLWIITSSFSSLQTRPTNSHPTNQPQKTPTQQPTHPTYYSIFLFPFPMSLSLGSGIFLWTPLACISLSHTLGQASPSTTFGGPGHF